jgi:outer membrane receptor protein involved in Fe transport
MKAGSFDLLNPSVLGEVKISEHVSATINAEFVYSSGKYSFRYKRVLPDGSVAWDTTAVRQNGDIHSIRTEAGLFGTTKHGLWQSKLYLYDSERGIPGAIVNNVWKRSQRQWDRNIFWQAGVNEQWNECIDVIANVKVAADQMRYLNPDTTLMLIDNHFQQLEVYAAVAHKYKVMNHWDVSLATDFQYNTLKANLQDFVYPVRYTALTAIATAATWKQVKVQASLLGSFVRDHFQRGQKNLRTTKQFDYVTPVAFLSYQPQGWKYVSLNTFAKQIFRMPTFNDLYYTDIGNADLQPEFTTQFDVGVQFNKSMTHHIVEHVEVKADAYYNQVTNKIIAVPKGTGQYRWMMMNLGYVEIKGLDVTAQVGWKVGQVRGATRINYTYQQAQDLSDPTDNDPRAGTYRRQIAYIPWHNGAVTTNLQWKQWIVNYSFVYVGERYHNSANVRENYEQPWYTHDMTISKEWKLKAGNHLKIALEVNNVLDQQYDVVLNYPMPGRNLKCILAWVL